VQPRAFGSAGASPSRDMDRLNLSKWAAPTLFGRLEPEEHYKRTEDKTINTGSYIDGFDGVVESFSMNEAMLPAEFALMACDSRS